MNRDYERIDQHLDDYESEGHYHEMEGLCERATEDAAEHSRARDVEAGIWRCKDGHPVHVSAMTPDHIRNALAMMRRNGFVGEKTFNFYLKTPGPSAEMAREAFEAELDNVLGSRVNPCIDLLEAELARRGLA